MEPQRWQQIDGIFAAALERDGAERAAFLVEACGDDQLLLTEVESLIAHVAPDDLSGVVAAEEAAHLLANEWRRPEMTSIGPYEVERLVGTGGMGEVYLAHDPRLNRPVAIKLLSHYSGSEEEQIRRFRQEGLAVSALNHPNILTIYEIGDFEGQPYIASEFISGVTLRARLGAGGIPLAMAIEIAIQVAGALAAAHEAAIVHRDIKPENLMIRADGLVKTLDFGIAKSTYADELQAHDQFATKPGAVVGTAPYMSPEQANGLAVDVRSDIWSLGVVLYEMVTGQVPFWGKTAIETISLILQREPAPLASYGLEVPDELESIIAKALTKDREERYQTPKDMLADLRRLKRQMEVVNARISTELRRRKFTGSRQHSQETDPVSTTTTTFASHSRYRLRSLAVAVLLLVAAAMVVAVSWLITHRPNKQPLAVVPFHEMNISRLTSSGKIKHAAISPNGNYVANVIQDAKGNSLWVRNLSSPTNVLVAGPSASECVWVTFAPDGDSIYYLALDLDKGDTELYRVPAVGGQSIRAAHDVGPVSFSSDRKQMTFIRMQREESRLIVSDADSTNQRTLTTRNQPDLLLMTWNAPAWSPDGKTIACPIRLNDDHGGYDSIVSISVNNGEQKPLTNKHWHHVGQPVWLANGSGLLVTATESATTPDQVWHISLNNGETTRITHDLNDYHGISLTGDSRRLAVVQDQSVSSIWVAPDADAGRAKEIASDKTASEELAWSPDGQIVYSSNVGDSAEIWVMNSDGSSPRQVTNGARASGGLTVSPDGRYIFFTSDRSGNFNIWRVDANGSNLRQLTSGEGEFYPQSTPNGEWIIFQRGDVEPTLWKVPSAGGNEVQVTRTRAWRPAVSADGQMVAYHYLDSDLNKWGIGMVSFPEGARVKRFDFPPTVSSRFVRWSPDRQAIAYVNSTGGVSDIWLQPISGGPAKPLTSFKAEQILAFDWSRDGHSLALVRGVGTSDVVLIEDVTK